MSNQPVPQIDPLFAEMIDDYFAECEEHLVALRHQLLEMEAATHGQGQDPNLVFETYRRFHSLKGLSGMVNFVELEELAHQVESFLRLLRDDEKRLDTSALDVMFAAVQAFEDGLQLRKNESRAADLGKITAEVRRLTPDTGSSGSTGSTGSGAESPAEEATEKASTAAAPGKVSSPAVPNGEPLWRFIFTPDAELQSRGVTVNAVRERLQKRGKVVQATPVILDGGGIAFHFLVSGMSQESLADFSREDGLNWQAEQAPAPAVQTDAPSPPPANATPAGRDPIGSDTGDSDTGGSDTGGADTGGAGGQSDGMRRGLVSTFVRVELARVEELMNMVGDLVTTRARLADAVIRLEDRSPYGEWSALSEANQALERKLRSLREGVMRVRLVPIGETFVRMQFVVRDLAREYQKQVKVELAGKETEIDKLIVDRLMDPLLHLVRNCVSHGLESPEEREAQGKAQTGRIVLRAFTEGNSVVVEVKDDGRGIDPKRIAQRAIELKLLDEDTPVTEANLLSIIGMTGFSTKKTADRGAGRGIGMPAVQESVRELGGVLALETTPGKGSTFRITVPLTLAITDAMIFSVGSSIFAMPQITINEVAEIPLDRIVRHPGGEIIHFRGRPVRVVRLARRFGLPPISQENGFLLIMGNRQEPVGLLVDRLLGIQEIVVRTVSDPLVETPDVIGASELGDGRTALILDSFSLVNQTRGTVYG